MDRLFFKLKRTLVRTSSERILQLVDIYESTKLFFNDELYIAPRGSVATEINL